VARERIWTWRNFFGRALSFLALKTQLVVLVSAFVTVSTVWSVSCLLFFNSRCPPRARPFIKVGARASRAPLSRRHCAWHKAGICVTYSKRYLTSVLFSKLWIPLLFSLLDGDLCSVKCLFPFFLLFADFQSRFYHMQWVHPYRRFKHINWWHNILGHQICLTESYDIPVLILYSKFGEKSSLTDGLIRFYDDSW